MRALYVIGLALLLAACTGKGSDRNAASVSGADQAGLRNAIRTQADDMQKKFMSGDLDGFIAYMHRDVIAMAGGEDQLRQKMAPALSNMVQTIEKISLGEISEVVDDGGTLAAFVPVETVYRYPTGGLIQKTFRIACSADGGRTWKFIEGQGRKDQEVFLKSKFPILTKKIPFPDCTARKL